MFASIFFPETKGQVYQLTEDGAGIQRVDLKDVSLTERIKNVFGFGSINLGKIADYCLKTDGKIRCDFIAAGQTAPDMQCDKQVFLQLLSHDSRMKDSNNRQEVFEKLEAPQEKKESKPKQKNEILNKVPNDPFSEEARLEREKQLFGTSEQEEEDESLEFWIKEYLAPVEIKRPYETGLEKEKLKETALKLNPLTDFSSRR